MNSICGPGAGIVAFYRAVWDREWPRLFPELETEDLSVLSSRPSRIGFQYSDSCEYLVTPFASQLSWLISSLVKHLASPGIGIAGSATRTRLAMRAKEHLAGGGWADEDEQALLIEVLDEACSILGEANEPALGALEHVLGGMARSRRVGSEPQSRLGHVVSKVAV